MASLLIGIVGLPNVGKSTLFNALSRNNVLAANYPFATIEPNTGVVAVADERLTQLEQLFKPERIVPATITFLDIAGLVAGAHKGEGLGNQFLHHIRTASVICHVVRAFRDPNVTHVNEVAEPKKDIETITTELVLADLQSLQQRLETLRPKAKTEPKLKPAVEFLEDIAAALDKGILVSTALANRDTTLKTLDSELRALVSNLLTAKPVIYVFNVDEDDLGNQELKNSLLQLVAPAPALLISARLEAELSQLLPEESAALLVEYGLKHSGLEQLTQVSYRTLGLQTFFTAGPKEVRAWTIRQGGAAPEAAGTIHTDFARGFIAAEVVGFNDLISAGSLAAAKAQGKIATCGRDYVVQDGDVIEFRFNV